jgi:sigma-E factor negative regulatory protein RseB
MTPMRNSSRLGLLGLALTFATAAAAEEPRAWLERMNQALTTSNYDGVFSHWQGGKVETLRIIHRVDAGQVRERLVSLDGSGREFIRTGNELTCYLPDRRTVVVERRSEQGPLLGNIPTFDASTAGLYDITDLKRARLMGREARVVTVSPKDEFRYGYRLWIDEATAMPLKTQLCNERGRVIEQIVFASLKVGAKIPDSEFNPDVSTEGFVWLRHESGGVPQQLASSVLWNALNLPPGFKMSARAAQVLPGSSDPVDHLVFTDGLAAVSVFVEPRSERAPPDPAAAGITRVGASSAFSTVIDGRKVTAVGEVPPATLRVIANSVKAESPAGPRR